MFCWDFWIQHRETWSWWGSSNLKRECGLCVHLIPPKSPLPKAWNWVRQYRKIRRNKENRQMDRKMTAYVNKSLRNEQQVHATVLSRQRKLKSKFPDRSKGKNWLHTQKVDSNFVSPHSLKCYFLENKSWSSGSVSFQDSLIWWNAHNPCIYQKWTSKGLHQWFPTERSSCTDSSLVSQGQFISVPMTLGGVQKRF